ncbi:MAG TPA: alpha/beta hydrolase [Candidatus Lokiarchaeia archaeon]|nr:alpha/beta hydrolase [Candidatus Lokiarchaeia archaeon]
MESLSLTATVNDVDIAYNRWGEGNPKRIMLVHGWGGFKELWNTFAPKLAEQAFDVVAMDLRGSGESSKPEMDYTHEVLSKDLYELAKYLGWSDGFIMLGQSMGGYVVLDYALRFPETLTHLIPSNTSVFLGRNLISKITWSLIIRMYKKNPEAMNRRMFPTFFKFPVAPEILEDFIVKSLNTPLYVGLSEIKHCYKENLEPQLHKITVPTLVISSQFDQKALRQATLQIHNLIPNSKLADISKTGHLPFMENPAEFLQAIVDFVQ